MPISTNEEAFETRRFVKKSPLKPPLGRRGLKMQPHTHFQLYFAPTVLASYSHHSNKFVNQFPIFNWDTVDACQGPKNVSDTRYACIGENRGQ